MAFDYGNSPLVWGNSCMPIDDDTILRIAAEGEARSDPYAADPAYKIAADLLTGCAEISKDRAKEHGGVTQEWVMTAKVWSVLLGIEVEPHQAMSMMTANKLVRLMLAPREDHFVDGANYLALAWGVLQGNRTNNAGLPPNGDATDPRS